MKTQLVEDEILDIMKLDKHIRGQSYKRALRRALKWWRQNKEYIKTEDCDVCYTKNVSTLSTLHCEGHPDDDESIHTCFTCLVEGKRKTEDEEELESKLEKKERAKYIGLEYKDIYGEDN